MLQDVSLACFSTPALTVLPLAARRCSASLLTIDTGEETIPARWKGPAFPASATTRRKHAGAAPERLVLDTDAPSSTASSVPAVLLDTPLSASARLLDTPLLNDEFDGRVVPTETETASGVAGEDDTPKSNKAQQVLQRIKDAGVAGVVSYGMVQLAFFGASIPACVFGYYQVAGHWPDLTSAEDQAELVAGAAAFLSLSRLLIPVRIAIALALAQGVQTNIIDRFQGGKMSVTSEAPPGRSVEGPSMQPTDGVADQSVLTSTSTCFYCSGSGQIPCGHCLASGELTFLDEAGVRVTQPCPNCAASSTVMCINCQGSGMMIMDT